MTVERTMNPPTPPAVCFDEPICRDTLEDPEEAVCIAPAAGVERSGGDVALTAAVDGLLSTSVTFGLALIQDSRARAGFAKATENAVAGLVLDVELGRMSSADAAAELHRLRGTLEVQLEAASSDVRRAWTGLRGSPTGETFHAAKKRVAEELFGEAAELTPERMRAVQARLAVELTEDGAAAARFGTARTLTGAGFIGISAAFAIHNIASAEDRMLAVAREAVLFGAGRLGAGLGGAAGAAACGPAAPVCVPVGALVGDVLFSMGAGALFDLAFGP